MAEEIVKYYVEVGFDTALKKLQDFEKKMGNFTNKQEKSIRSNQKLMNAHHKEREKHLTKEYNNKVKQEKGVSKAHIAAIKENIKFDKKAAIERAKAGLSSGLPKNDAHIKARQAEVNRQARMESRRVSNLAAAKETFGRSSINLRGSSKPSELAAQAAVREAVAKATTANQVRMIVAKERERLRVMKQQERNLHKQNFLMQRMQSSSKQLAGNMVSAFAVAGLSAGITRVGQDFEAVNNTMLAVSKDSVDAGNNFKFVRDEAYRLGLGLTQSAKGYAKMVAAMGTMSKKDVEGIFTGVSELGTVLGLTAEESNRAVNAITQMMSKGKISAEELRLQLG